MAPRMTLVLGAAAAAAAAAGAGCGGDDRPAPEPPPVEITALHARRVDGDVRAADPAAPHWRGAPRGIVTLVAQPMIAPRPETTTTERVIVAAVHDGRSIAFRLEWDDGERSEAGRLGEFSDAVAIQFPIGDPATTPVMMGARDLPVHIFHWRAQYQRDRTHGKPEMNDLYPNMAVDMYPMEFAHAPGGTPDQREAFSPGRAAGNPQAYAKRAVDEVIAEGFATSAVQEGHSGDARGEWVDGRWTVVITRPLAVDGGAALAPGAASAIAFAVWQGGHQEVGSRKSVTMSWLPLEVAP